ncbi:hypothetical protein DV515_00010610 [Chloebia gouldiae]|uniref:ribonuclease H n=1 Tax=Chloebia gouldiae TaxID=44316 RepID=A0A3L8S8S0_CHLGU|nr:hypothetical protein DV515_00010610 [Chloebia gouldiae]
MGCSQVGGSNQAKGKHVTITTKAHTTATSSSARRTTGRTLSQWRRGTSRTDTASAAGPRQDKRKSRPTAWHSSTCMGERQESGQDGCVLELPTNCPWRPTGQLFLVDKNSRNTKEVRLVVDFSHFSRGKNGLSFPKYWAPNLHTLSRILPLEMSWISLDVSQAFYHVPMHRLRATRLAICDGEWTYYFRKAPKGISLNPFLLHLFSTALAAKINHWFNIWAFAYMDFLLGHPSHHYLATASHTVYNILQQLGIRINYDKATPSPMYEIIFLDYKIDHLTIQILDEQWTKTRQTIKKISSTKEYG